jgi:hypothetical protein
MNTPDNNRLQKLAGILPLYEDVNPYEDAPQEDPTWWKRLITPIIEEWMGDYVDGLEANPGGVPDNDEDRNNFILSNSDNALNYVFAVLYDEKGFTDDDLDDYEEMIVKTVDSIIMDITGAVFENTKLEDINPYEDSNEHWWWDDESNDGVSWWNVEDLLKKISEKVVGPDYGVYAKIWYNILSHYADDLWNTTPEEYFDEVEMKDTIRQNVVDNVGERYWNQFLGREIKYYISEYQILYDNPDALSNFKKIGELAHKALESKEKPSLNEDVNPYEDSDDYWWYDDDGYGIDQDAIMEAIKAATKKVVGDTAPNRNSYFNVWYDILDSRVTDASQNVDDYDDEDEVFGAARGEIEYYTDPENWEDAKEMIVYDLESYRNIVANKKTIDNFQKIGAILHKLLMTNIKPSLNEDVNPYADADLSDYDEFLGSYIKVCAKYFPAFTNDPELADQLKDKTLGDFVFEYLKQDATLSQRDEPKELFDTFSEEDIMKRIKLLANEA